MIYFIYLFILLFFIFASKKKNNPTKSWMFNFEIAFSKLYNIHSWHFPILIVVVGYCKRKICTSQWSRIGLSADHGR